MLIISVPALLVALALAFLAGVFAPFFWRLVGRRG